MLARAWKKPPGVSWWGRYRNGAPKPIGGMLATHGATCAALAMRVCCVQGQFVYPNDANFSFVRKLLVVAVLWVAQAWAPLSSAIIVWASKCALGHNENILREDK